LFSCNERRPSAYQANKAKSVGVLIGLGIIGKHDLQQVTGVFGNTPYALAFWYYYKDLLLQGVPSVAYISFA
jgi:hypothetical protein